MREIDVAWQMLNLKYIGGDGSFFDFPNRADNDLAKLLEVLEMRLKI